MLGGCGWPIPLGLRRRWQLRRAPAGPLRDFYRVPFPDPGMAWHRVEYVAMDMETTGLDARRDEILSIGWVVIRDGAVRLGEAGHLFVRPTRPVPEEAAVVHGILDDIAARGRTLAEVVPEVLAALAGKVLLAHHAVIEQRFLDRACRRLYGRGLLCPVVDTLQLEARRFHIEGRPIVQGDLRLHQARARHGLPRYPAHDALSDALAAAELFLAQAQQRAVGGRTPRLRDLAVRC
ncbi:exonuclease domain-containing protein [Inmirania thermothiophila]|uniref:DNA-directed DNA polymerase n=1 Tax=Inmirania thermothiophila TaxID=1750597 RepID=A0A3N1XWS9_9GAMM|nr:exonuclease domain-containing protein [Inmirania thermothiophila]ROR29642.1 DNA polymerase-3 subunit epsilon [Inmirania thermothiophila]